MLVKSTGFYHYHGRKKYVCNRKGTKAGMKSYWFLPATFLMYPVMMVAYH